MFSGLFRTKHCISSAGRDKKASRLAFSKNGFVVCMSDVEGLPKFNFPFVPVDIAIVVIRFSMKGRVSLMVAISNISICGAICLVCCGTIQGQNLSDSGLIEIASPIAKVGDDENDGSNAELFPRDEESELTSCANLDSRFASECNSGNRMVYTSLNLAGSFNHLSSGGFNTVGFFENTGSDNEDAFDIGGAIGVYIPKQWGGVRIECEAMGRDIFNSVTDSYLPPTPSFFYDVTVNNRWTALANVWFDVPWRNCKNVYFGGGLGTGGGSLAIDDGVVQGSGGFTEGVWQLGFGVNRKRNKGVTFDLGYRFVDFGTAGIAINNGLGGNYTLETTAHQIMLGIRFNSIRQLLTRR